MQDQDFADLVAGMSEAYLCEFLQVDLKTLRRWKAGTTPAPHAVRLLLRLKLEGELTALGGDAWEGFRLGRDGLLYIPLFHRGFDPLQIQAMFFTTQDAWADKRDVNALQRDLAALRADYDALARREAFYRRQCQIESRMGLMLARIVG